MGGWLARGMLDTIAAAEGAADFPAWMPQAKGTMEADDAGELGVGVAPPVVQPATMTRATPMAANFLNPSRQLRIEAIGTSLTRL